jgi:hypothetical protein
MVLSMEGIYEVRRWLRCQDITYKVSWRLVQAFKTGGYGYTYRERERHTHTDIRQGDLMLVLLSIYLSISLSIY